MSVVIQKHVLTLKFTVSCKHLYRANFGVFLKCWDFLKLSSVCYYHRGSWNCDLSKGPPGPGRVGIFFHSVLTFVGFSMQSLVMSLNAPPSVPSTPH